MKDSFDDYGPNDELQPEDMSLTDLLGSDAVGAQPVPDPAVKRVNDRPDEMDSGLVALAHMVAKSSVKTAQTPSIAPPAYKGPSSLAPPPPDPFDPPPLKAPSFDAPTFDQVSIPPVAIRKKRSAIPVFVVIIAIAAGVSGGYYYVQQGKDQAAADETEQAELARKIAWLRAKQQAEMEPKSAPSDRKEQAADARSGGNEAARTEAAALDDQDKDEVEPRTLQAASIGGRESQSSRRRSSRRTRHRATTSTKSADPDPAEEPTSRSKKSIFASSSSKTDDSDLDSLLGPMGKTEPRPRAKQTKPSGKSEPSIGDTPNKPSKATVRKVMGSVSSQASQACAIYSTGIVQVQVVVANNGAVTSARPLGSFANTNVGKCAAMMAKRAKFPPFSDPTFTFKYPIVIR